MSIRKWRVLNTQTLYFKRRDVSFIASCISETCSLSVTWYKRVVPGIEQNAHVVASITHRRTRVYYSFNTAMRSQCAWKQRARGIRRQCVHNSRNEGGRVYLVVVANMISRLYLGNLMFPRECDTHALDRLFEDIFSKFWQILSIFQSDCIF